MLKAIWPFVTAVLKHWWALLSCALFTFIGVYATQYGMPGQWIVSASYATAIGCVFIAMFLAWFDIYKELHSRPIPGVTARWVMQIGQSYQEITGFRLMLQNTGQAVAVNVSAIPLKFDMPDSYKSTINQIVANSGLETLSHIEAHAPTAWGITFRSIDKLVGGDSEQELSYRISEMGLFQKDIGEILRYLIGADLKATFPYAIEFSDTSYPAKIWHTHYEAEFRFHPKKEHQTITSRFEGFFEVEQEDGKCSCCRQA